MTVFESRIEILTNLLKLHPNGTHFCTTTRQSGFALNAEDLLLILENSTLVMETLREIANCTDMGGYELEEAAYIARMTLDHLDKEGGTQ